MVLTRLWDTLIGFEQGSSLHNRRHAPARSPFPPTNGLETNVPTGMAAVGGSGGLWGRWAARLIGLLSEASLKLALEFFRTSPAGYGGAEGLTAILLRTDNSYDKLSRVCREIYHSY